MVEILTGRDDGNGFTGQVAEESKAQNLSRSTDPEIPPHLARGGGYEFQEKFGLPASTRQDKGVLAQLISHLIEGLHGHLYRTPVRVQHSHSGKEPKILGDVCIEGIGIAG